MSAPVYTGTPYTGVTPMTRVDMDGLQCQCGQPTCTVDKVGLASLRAKCHPQAPALAWYVANQGCLLLACAICGEGIALIQVASQVPS